MVLAGSLKGMYPVLGGMMLASACVALLLPPVRGYQRDQKRMSFTIFFKDPSLVLLFSVVFLGQMVGQFSITFFSKHLGDLGASNALTGLISTLSVSLEIPFLLFADKLMEKLPVWKWMWIGLVGSAVRFLLLSVVRAPALIVIAQLFSVFQLSCFEFFPYVYLGRIAQKEMLSTVQATYQMIAFGVSRIMGSLVGGFIADAAGIPVVFAINGCIMLVAAIALYAPLHRQAKKAG